MDFMRTQDVPSWQSTKDFSVTESSSSTQSSNEFQICISSCILTSHGGRQTNPHSPAFFKLTPLSGFCLT